MKTPLNTQFNLINTGMKLSLPREQLPLPLTDMGTPRCFLMPQRLLDAVLEA